MLPDFKSTKKKIETAIYSTVTNKVHDGPLLSQIPKKVHLEGQKHSFIDSTGEYVENEYDKVDSQFSIGNEEVLEKGLFCLVEKCIKATDEMNEKITLGVIEEIKKAAAKAGNEINSKGKSPAEVYLESVETIQVDFDDRGDPYLPSLYTDPSTALRENKRSKEYFDKNPNHEYEFNEKLDKIIEKKREEWDDRESNRKLVD